MTKPITIGVRPAPETLNFDLITDESLNQLFLYHFQELIGPYYVAAQQIKDGHVYEALESSDGVRGIFYGNTFAKALVSLGNQEISVRAKSGAVNKMAASKLHTTLKDNYFFYISKGSSAHWERLTKSEVKRKYRIYSDINPSPWRINGLRLKSGASPSRGFQSFASSLSFLDCENIIHVAIALTLIDIFGEETFDRVFQNGIDLGIPGHLFFASFCDAGTLPKIDSLDFDFDAVLKPGETFYLSNVSHYSKKHPHGNAQGFNLVYLGENRFTGLGLPPEGMTLREIAETLRAKYNETPIDPRILLPERDVINYFETITVPIGGKQTIIPHNIADLIIEKATHTFSNGLTLTTQQIRDELLPGLEQYIANCKKIKADTIEDREAFSEQVLSATNSIISRFHPPRFNLEKIKQYMAVDEPNKS